MMLSGKRRIWVFACVSVFLSTFLTLGFAELGFRGWLYWQQKAFVKGYREHLGARQAKVLTEYRPAQLDEIVKMSQNERLLFELKANMAVTFMGKKVKTNSNGLRVAPPTTVKPTDTCRIVGIGDSWMFGWGAEQGKDHCCPVNFHSKAIWLMSA